MLATTRSPLGAMIRTPLGVRGSSNGLEMQVWTNFATTSKYAQTLHGFKYTDLFTDRLKQFQLYVRVVQRQPPIQTSSRSNNTTPIQYSHPPIFPADFRHYNGKVKIQVVIVSTTDANNITTVLNDEIILLEDVLQLEKQFFTGTENYYIGTPKLDFEFDLPSWDQFYDKLNDYADIPGYINNTSKYAQVSLVLRVTLLNLNENPIYAIGSDGKVIKDINNETQSVKIEIPAKYYPPITTYYQFREQVTVSGDSSFNVYWDATALYPWYEGFNTRMIAYGHYYPLDKNIPRPAIRDVAHLYFGNVYYFEPSLWFTYTLNQYNRFIFVDLCESIEYHYVTRTTVKYDYYSSASTINPEPDNTYFASRFQYAKTIGTYSLGQETQPHDPIRTTASTAGQYHYSITYHHTKGDYIQRNYGWFRPQADTNIHWQDYAALITYLSSWFPKLTPVIENMLVDANDHAAVYLQAVLADQINLPVEFL